MDTKMIEYYGYIIEIHEHPIYHDFEYVIKTKEGKVISASYQKFDYAEDAERVAQLSINEF